MNGSLFDINSFSFDYCDLSYYFAGLLAFLGFSFSIKAAKTSAFLSQCLHILHISMRDPNWALSSS